MPWNGKRAISRGAATLRLDSDTFAAVHARKKCFFGRLSHGGSLRWHQLKAPTSHSSTSEQHLPMLAQLMHVKLPFFSILFSLLPFCKKKQRTGERTRMEYLLNTRFIGWAWILILCLNCRISSLSFYKKTLLAVSSLFLSCNINSPILLRINYLQCLSPAI